MRDQRDPKKKPHLLRSMEDPKSPPLLPPGFRFYPTEQQIFSFYLSIKNNNLNPNNDDTYFTNPRLLSFDVIQEIDLYNNDPYDLPEMDSFSYGCGARKRHWYYFTVRVGKEGLRRKAKDGFWKRKGPIRIVLDEKDGVVLGTKTTFVFYTRDSTRKGAVRTNWFMIEYALVDHHHLKDSFVLCRIYLKPQNGSKPVEIARNSYVEESIAANQNSLIDKISKTRDGVSMPDIAKLQEGTLVDMENGVERCPVRQTAEPDEKVVNRSICNDGIGSFLDIRNLNEPVKFSSDFTGGDTTFNDFMSDELRVNSTILEGDFIELNDLVGPLVFPFASG